MLDASTIAIDAALRSYGIVGGAHRLTTAAQHVADDPSSLDAEVDRWATISARTDAPPAMAANGKAHRDDLAQRARQLRILQDSISTLAAEQLRLIQQQHARRPEHPGVRPAPQRPIDTAGLEVLARQQPLAGATPFAPVEASGTPDQRLARVRAALHARRAQYRTTWIAAERAHPVLATFRGRDTPDAASLDALAPGTDVPRAVLHQALPKLANIYRTKRALQSDLDPLQLAPVIALTKQRMFVAEGSYRDRVVHDLAQQAAEHRSAARWAFDAVLLGLTLVTLVPTAGASAGIALSLTGLAYDLYASFEAADDYGTNAAAANTDLDALRSLADAEPSLAPLLTRIVSAGLNLTAAAALFRRAAALRRAAAQGALDADALAQLNRDGDRLGLRAVGDEAVESLSQADARLPIFIEGNAQTPKTLPWRINEGGRVRTAAEARAIAESHDIDVPEDTVFVAVEQRALPPKALASYLKRQVNSLDELVTWDEFYNRFEQIPIRLSKDILNSDEAIVAVVAHEMHELNALRALFEERGGAIPARELRLLTVAERPGNLHDHAWDEADRAIAKMRSEKP